MGTSSLDLYLISGKRGKLLLFAPPSGLAEIESAQSDRIHKSILWLRARGNRIVRWLGRVLERAYHYYQRLEDKIDPAERAIKALAGCDRIRVYCSQRQKDGRAHDRFRQMLMWQRWKHTVWLFIDGILTVGVVALTPVLAPIPGPNVFFYYPALRLMSHFRAQLGARRALAEDIEVHTLTGLDDLERAIASVPSDKAAAKAVARGMSIEGFENFLERMI